MLGDSPQAFRGLNGKALFNRSAHSAGPGRWKMEDGRWKMEEEIRKKEEGRRNTDKEFWKRE